MVPGTPASAWDRHPAPGPRHGHGLHLLLPYTSPFSRLCCSQIPRSPWSCLFPDVLPGAKVGGSGRWILSIPQSGGWYKVMGPGARMGGQRPWRALERLPASAFMEGVPRTRGRETMCSPLPRGAHEAAGTQAGRQTAATPCMGSSGAVGTESGKKLTNHPGG